MCEVWPENETPLDLFSSLLTQWRTGFAGPVGLDYAAIPAVMELMEIQQTRRREVFDAMRVMEAEALKVFADRGKRK